MGNYKKCFKNLCSQLKPLFALVLVVSLPTPQELNPTSLSTSTPRLSAKA